ncbi:MAG: hypothetical protein IH614_01725 [Desulfuromonadales bacterium]|nr:hypothetical protein [Desulfuromonadales bacterium]
MKTRHAVTLGVLLSGLLTASAMAADCGTAAATPPQGGEQVVTQDAQPGTQEGQAVAPGVVPQSQVDYFNKKEEARRRRDEALKVRQQMMQTGQ